MKVNSLKIEYNKKEKEIKKRLNEFKKNKKEAIFYELCFCLLTPGSKARNCDLVINDLMKSNFMNKKIKFNLKGVRFHNNKTKRLIEAKNNFYIIFNEINKRNSKEAREWLVKNVNGLGYKEASHFLRNIGYSNLAILDRHILKNLKKYQVIEEIPISLTKKKYLEIEKKFQEFADKIKIPLDELDLLFWSFETGEIFK